MLHATGIFTLPETNSLHLKFDGWNMNIPFAGAMFVSREGTYIYPKHRLFMQVNP